jgi:hypothetical protein
MNAPGRYSAYRFSSVLKDSDGNLYMTEREPFRYRDLGDNRAHTVVQGDTLWTLAGKYFRRFPDPNQLFFVIADYQPDPIIDCTLELEVGRVLIIPSARTIDELIFSESRRDELAA